MPKSAHPTPELIMIKVTTIGSGSSGNCYIIESTREDGFVEQLILEAGEPFENVEKALKFDLSHISGCLVSHEHGDHAKYIRQYTRRGVEVLATFGTLSALHIKEKIGERYRRIIKRHRYQVGGFRVKAFEAEHDAAEPCGFMIDCPNGDRVLFATDTYYLKYRFAGVNYFLIEANYDERTLYKNIKSGLIHPTVGERVTKSHLSLRQCIKALKANDLSRTKAIILIHLSNDNSNADSFEKSVEDATGKSVFVARKGKVFNLI